MHMQHWIDGKGNHQTGKVPVQVGHIIDAIGLDDTVKLMLELGGAPVYFGPDRSEKDARLATCLGMESARILAEKMRDVAAGPTLRIPLAPKFLARHLRGKGTHIHEIARLLHRSDVSVRAYLKPDGFDRQKALKEAKRLEERAETLRIAASVDADASRPAGKPPLLSKGTKPCP